MFQVKLLILSGFIWMARGFEIVILLNISDLVACTWDLRRWQSALLHTVGFGFTVVGGFLFGIWADTYGRRTALSSCLIFLFVFHAVSAGLPTYSWFAIFRSVIGFAYGGVYQTLVLCCEYMPRRQRGRAIYILSLFYALGALIMHSVFYAILDSKRSWRMFVAVGALPSFLAMVLMRFFPESFRFLMVTRQHFAADEIFAEMCESNGKPVPGKLIHLPRRNNKAITTNLLSPPFAVSTVMLWLLGIATAISLAGLEILTPELIRNGRQNFHAASVETNDFLGDQFSPVNCTNTMVVEDFILRVWTMALNFPGYIIFLILVDVVGRKKLLSASLLISSLFIFFLCIPAPGVTMYIVFVFCAKLILQGLFPLLLLITAELFPTCYRGTAVGLEASSMFLGFVLSTYIAKCLALQNFLYPFILYGVLTFFCGIASPFLKCKTQEGLKDVIEN